VSDRSGIEWTEATWNPVTGCTKVSAGCDNCYADRFAERWRGLPGHPYEQGFDLRLWPDRLVLPLRWRRPRMVFVNSMSDLFHDQVPDEFIAAVFATMALAGRHTFQVLTKRHARMRHLLTSPGFHRKVGQQATELISSRPWRCWQLDLGGQRLAGDSGLGAGWTATPGPAGHQWLPRWPLPNVWLGVSAENQRWAEIRIPALLRTPAAVRFVSCEPLLGAIDLKAAVWSMGSQRGHGLAASFVHAGGCCNRFHGLDWVIAGGESGPRTRPMHPDWPRQLRDQCAAAGVAFFFKQWGGRTPTAGGRLLDGQTWDELPREAGDRRAQAA
jgi:protein gp37